MCFLQYFNRSIIEELLLEAWAENPGNLTVKMPTQMATSQEREFYAKSVSLGHEIESFFP